MPAASKRPLTPIEYAGIARRRWLWILVPTILIAAGTYAGARKLPKTYTSSALILVEPQRVPTNLVQSTVSSSVADLLENIREQILSRTQLSQIIQKYGLYRDRGLTEDGQVTLLNDDITVTPIAADDEQKKDISAIRISYEGYDPVLAQEVTRDLSNLFLQKNLDVRAQEAEGTEGFINGQLSQAQTALQTLEAQLTQLKSQYMGSLPEQQSSNLVVMGQLQTVLQAETDALASAQQQRTYLTSLGQAVANMSQPATATATGAPAPNPTEVDLEKAKTDLAAAEQLYTPQHPDVIRLQAQVNALTEQLNQEKAAAKKAAATASDAANATAAGAKDKAKGNLPPDVQGQIAVIDQEIKQRTAEQAATQAKINALQKDIEQLPAVEEKLTNLQNQYDVAKANYTKLLEEQQQAAMGAAMEQQAEGQEFSIVDPANLPQKPSSPNLMQIDLMGGVGGLFVGCGLAFLIEMRNQVARTEDDLAFYARVPMLATLPLISRLALPAAPLEVVASPPPPEAPFSYNANGSI